MLIYWAGRICSFHVYTHILHIYIYIFIYMCMYNLLNTYSRFASTLSPCLTTPFSFKLMFKQLVKTPARAISDNRSKVRFLWNTFKCLCEERLFPHNYIHAHLLVRQIFIFSKNINLNILKGNLTKIFFFYLFSNFYQKLYNYTWKFSLYEKLKLFTMKF